MHWGGIEGTELVEVEVSGQGCKSSLLLLWLNKHPSHYRNTLSFLCRLQNGVSLLAQVCTMYGIGTINEMK